MGVGTEVRAEIGDRLQSLEPHEPAGLGLGSGRSAIPPPAIPQGPQLSEHTAMVGLGTWASSASLSSTQFPTGLLLQQWSG